ncbi:DUF2207 domain-containing protein [Bacillus sp. KH172YL63]|uniref:DUF2207 domain-containing protein n=1 Tax=Bacillus sp. KH172YL63 TaxID=2709784 RepID=UPI0013E4279A|nr:DUF2207 domain-containing protein [Bacillus sp. KH172YL63]BCB04210.1 hypothetical protein KH172YL63_23430 [Bacillus sp. KH172YL63]
MIKKLLLIFILFFSVSQTAYGKSFTIDEVRIRAWIQPNGNLLVNEMFTYSFDGKFKRVSRSIHEDNHDEVQWFKSYELLNQDGELGFLNEDDVRPLNVEQEGNTFRSSYPVEDDSATFLYVYELENAVRSYETYSDVTVPFFQSGSNHDVDLNHVTIDFVFPEKIDPKEYEAFIHDREGHVEQKGPEVVRFITPVSKMHSLTETRVLFPSSIMKEQEKAAAPQSLEHVIQKEEERMELAERRKEQLDTHNKFLAGLTIFLVLLGAVMFLGSLIGRIRGKGDVSDVLKADPLLLYMVHHRGRFTHGSLMAGLYSLIEAGKATVRKQKTTTRFLTDTRSPDETLFFTLTSDDNELTPIERQFVSWVFKRKGRNGSASFAMTDLAGATKKEKDLKRHVKTYHTKVKLLKEQEREWFQALLKEAKSANLLHARLFHFITKVPPVLVYIGILAALYFDEQSSFALWMYAVVGAGGLILMWVKKEKKWPVVIWTLISVFASLQIVNETAVLYLFLSIMLTLILCILVPRHTLSVPGLDLKAGIRSFRKQVRKKEVEGDMDRWMIRSMLLERKRKLKKLWVKDLDSSLLSTAPLTALILTNQNPQEFLTNSWKWSVPPPSPSSGFSDGGYSGGGGDGGGGGGGAGAD